MTEIDWKRLDQAQFDGIVESLFTNHYSDQAWEVIVVNGRGGDGGIDIQLRDDTGCLVIVQLKYFPEGFSGGFAKTRRPQIEKSFKSALKHDPDEWWLVIPNTVTETERKFVHGPLAAKRKVPQRPTIRIFDRTQLNGLAAAHPDLVTYFMRDELREVAKDYGHERALLVDTDDLVARVAALSKQADTLHPDWRLDVFAKGDVVGTTLVAKHPYAAERSPVTVSMNVTFGPDQADLRESFERAMNYGTPDQIDLPASAVSDFAVDGPEFIAHTSDDVAVSWIPADPSSVGRVLSLIVLDDDGKPASSFAGATTWTGAAQAGASLRAAYFGALEVQLLLPFDATVGGQMSIGLSFGGCMPADVANAVTMIEHLEAANQFAVELDGARLARMTLTHDPAAMFGEERSAIAVHKEIADDLATVQGDTARLFLYPDEVQPVDRIRLRCLRLLLEGKCIVLPGQRNFTLTLNGHDGETLRHLLRGDHMTLAVDMSSFGMEVMGNDLQVGAARVYAPQVSIDNEDGAAALDALDNGTAEGMEVTLRCREGYGFWVYLPERYVEPADQVLRPCSLGLDGFTDAPDVARAVDASEPTKIESAESDDESG